MVQTNPRSLQGADNTYRKETNMVKHILYHMQRHSPYVHESQATNIRRVNMVHHHIHLFPCEFQREELVEEAICC